MIDHRTASAGAYKAHASRKRKVLEDVKQKIADTDAISEQLRDEAMRLRKEIAALEEKAVRAAA